MQITGSFIAFSLCVPLGQPTCCWTGAAQRWPLWGQWVTGWTAWEPCPARRPSLGSATAPATPWPRPPLSKTTTDNTHSKLPCLFTSGVLTGSQYAWNLKSPLLKNTQTHTDTDTHTQTHLLTLLSDVSEEIYGALTKGVQIKVMLI